MASWTSRMKALSGLERWNLEAVDIYYRKVLTKPKRKTVITGEVVRDTETGDLFLFLWREGDNISLEPHDIDDTEEEFDYIWEN